jgi:hypothetical protein
MVVYAEAAYNFRIVANQEIEIEFVKCDECLVIR